MTVEKVGESQARVQAAKRSITLYSEGLLSQAELSFRSAIGLSDWAGGVLTLLEAQRALREARMGYYKATASIHTKPSGFRARGRRDLQ